jgi:hypothetical protein
LCFVPDGSSLGSEWMQVTAFDGALQGGVFESSLTGVEGQ